MTKPNPASLAASLGAMFLAATAVAQTSQTTQNPPPAAPPAQGAATNPASQAASGQTAGASGGIMAAKTATVQLKFVSVQPADMIVSRLMGTNVYNNQNESIGEIEDLVIENGKTLKAVVVGVGGFLGMGERYAAVDPSSIVLDRQGENNWRAVVNTSRDDLKKAPTFDYSKKR